MQLANFMNEIKPLDIEALLRRLAHKARSDDLAAQIRAWHADDQAGFWFSTANFTAFVYGMVLPLARARLAQGHLAAADFIRGVLLHFACRESDAGTHVVLASALRPSDAAFLDFPKNSADFVFCRHPAAAASPGVTTVPAAGNLLFDATLADLAQLLRPGSVSTLFFDMSENPAEDIRLLQHMAPLLAADATLIAQGPADLLHALFVRLTQQGAARMWAQCVVDGVTAGKKHTFAYFELLNKAALPRHDTPHTRVMPNAPRIEPPGPAGAGPYRYAEGQDVHAHATATLDFAAARVVPFRAPLFVHGAENANSIWMGQFGRTAQEWLYLPDTACPPLRCSRFDNLRLVGTEACITHQDVAFYASQIPMPLERFVGWSPVYRSDIREVAGGIASARACTVGQRLSAPTVILSNGGLPMHYHFLFDTLPRLWFLGHAALANHRIALPDTVRPYQIEALTKYYGIEQDRIDIFASTGAACLFDQAWAAPSMVSDWWAMPETTLAPRTALRHATPPREEKFRNARRLYISRRDVVDSRGLVNETELVERLAALGFVEIFPSAFPYDQEMHLFNNADIVIGPFGSGMANLMFCKPGAKVVLLQPDSTNWRILSFVMHALDLQYGYVFGEAFRKRARGHNTEWIIDVDAVVARVDGLL